MAQLHQISVPSEPVERAPFDATQFAIAFLAVIVCVGVPALANIFGYTRFALGFQAIEAVIGLSLAFKIARLR